MRAVRNIVLRPVLRTDLPLIFRLFADFERSYVWGHRKVCDEQQIVETWRCWSHERMGAKFTILRRGQPIGLVFDYERSLEDGHTKLATLLVHEATGCGAGVIATAQFCQWLFQQVPLRKAYFDVFEFNRPVVMMLAKLGVQQEMRRKQHRYYSGQYWDQFEFALYREEIPGLVQRVLRERPNKSRLGPPQNLRLPQRVVAAPRPAAGGSGFAARGQSNDASMTSLLFG